MQSPIMQFNQLLYEAALFLVCKSLLHMTFDQILARYSRVHVSLFCDSVTYYDLRRRKFCNFSLSTTGSAYWCEKHKSEKCKTTTHLIKRLTFPRKPVYSGYIHKLEVIVTSEFNCYSVHSLTWESCLYLQLLVLKDDFTWLAIDHLGS